MLIRFIVDYLLKKDSVEISLLQEKQSLDSIVEKLYKEISLIKETMNKENQNLNQENIILKADIENLKKENNILKEEINHIKKLLIKVSQNNESNPIEDLTCNSVIIQVGEIDMIKSAIKSRMNKEIKFPYFYYYFISFLSFFILFFCLLNFFNADLNWILYTLIKIYYFSFLCLFY